MRLSSTVKVITLVAVLFSTPISTESAARKEDLVDDYLTGFVLFRHVGADTDIEFLLQKKTGDNRNEEWGLVHGNVEDTDNSIFDAAVRIVFEQTGLTPEDYEPRGLRQMTQYVDEGKVTQVNLWPAKLHWPDMPFIPESQETEYNWTNISVTERLLNKRWNAELSLIHDSLIP